MEKEHAFVCKGKCPIFLFWYALCRFLYGIGHKKKHIRQKWFSINSTLLHLAVWYSDKALYFACGSTLMKFKKIWKPTQDCSEQWADFMNCAQEHIILINQSSLKCWFQIIEIVKPKCIRMCSYANSKAKYYRYFPEFLRTRGKYRCIFLEYDRHRGSHSFTEGSATKNGEHRGWKQYFLLLQRPRRGNERKYCFHPR